MDLKKVWMAELEILSQIDVFCREHGLKYSLAYGTMIGAVRHGGFIPWDDDIDIIMPRADYEFLISNWNVQGLLLYRGQSGVARPGLQKKWREVLSSFRIR